MDAIILVFIPAFLSELVKYLLYLFLILNCPASDFRTLLKNQAGTLTGISRRSTAAGSRKCYKMVTDNSKAVLNQIRIRPDAKISIPIRIIRLDSLVFASQREQPVTKAAFRHLACDITELTRGKHVTQS
jgi:hypothetical protein